MKKEQLYKYEKCEGKGALTYKNLTKGCVVCVTSHQSVECVGIVR